MFTVYKITNLVNNKCYIGSSIRVNQRWNQHKTIAFNPNHRQYNNHLYRAFRKYGLENFKFEILSQDYDSIEDMEQGEKEFIVFYNSVEEGYNQTYNTNSHIIAQENLTNHLQKVSQRCALVDKNENIIEIYSSYQEASRKQGDANNASAIRKVSKGMSSSLNGKYFRDLDENNNVIHQDFKPYKNRKALIGISLDDETEVYVESILKASEIFHCNRQSLQKCINGDPRYTNVAGYVWRLVSDGDIVENNIPIDSVISEYNRTHPQINGVRHTIKEWCKIYNISAPSVYKRIEKGMTLIEAITMPKRR